MSHADRTVSQELQAVFAIGVTLAFVTLIIATAASLGTRAITAIENHTSAFFAAPGLPEVLQQKGTWQGRGVE